MYVYVNIYIYWSIVLKIGNDVRVYRMNKQISHINSLE